MHHFVRTLSIVTSLIALATALGGCSDGDSPKPPTGEGTATPGSEQVSSEEGAKTLEDRRPAPEDAKAERDECAGPAGRHSPACAPDQK